MKKIHSTILKNVSISTKFLIGAFIFSISAFVLNAFAAPPSSPYSPGDTLSPSCSPGDTNCTVSAPAASGSNSDITALTGLTTDLSVSQGGTGASTASDARANLGLVIGSDVQGFNAYLTDIANITANQGDIIYFNGTDWVDLAPGTSGQFLKTQGSGANPVWDSVSASVWTDGGTVTYLTSQTDDFSLGGVDSGAPLFFDASAEILTLTNTTAGDSFRVNDSASDTSPFIIDASGNVGIGTTSLDSKLNVAGTFGILEGGVSPVYYTVFQGGDQSANITYTLPTADGSSGQVLSTNGSGVLSWASTGSGDLLATNNLSDLASTSTARTNLGVAIGSDVQAYDAQLLDIANLSVTDGNFIVGNGTNFVAESGSTARTSLGLGTGDSPQFTDLTLTGNQIVNAQGELRLADADSSNYVGFQATTTVSSNQIWTLPATDGSSGQVLSTNGSGVLSWTSSAGATAIDDLSDAQNDSTNNNLFLGGAGFSGTFYNDYNVAIGLNALATANTDNTQTYFGDSNTAVGIDVLTNNSSGYANTAVGRLSLNTNTTGYMNTAAGVSSLYSNTTGFANVAFGHNSLYFNTEGSSNVAYGYYSLYSNTTGLLNTAQGANAISNNTTGNYNTAQGSYALYANTTGSYNIAQGYRAGQYITDGSTANTTGDYNIFIGANTKALADNDQNEIVIGYNATGLGSNTVVLGNDSISTTALKGSVGIGTTSPVSKMHIYQNDTNTGTAAGLTIEQAGTGDVVTQYLLSGVRRWVLGADNSDSDKFKIAPSTDVGIDTSLTITSAGDVGIGTVSPLAKFHVEGDSGGADLFRVSSSNANYAARMLFMISGQTKGFYVGQVNTNEAQVWNANSGPLRLATNDSERMRISGDGKVGINNTSPSDRLHISAGGLGGLTMDGDRPFISLKHTGTAGYAAGISWWQDSTKEMELFYNTSNDEIYFWDSIAGASRVTIERAGNVGIGTDAPGSYKLYVNGSAYSTGGWSSSDERWKKNVETLDGALEKVNQLRGVRFEWNQEDYPDMNFMDGKQIGFIAQEMEGVVPEFVSEDDKGYKAVAYQNITALNLEAIKELDLKLEGLTASVSVMEMEDGLFAKRFFVSIFDKLRRWFANSTNGISDLFVNRVKTTEICLSDDKGETCINRSQLDDLLNNINSKGE